MTAEAKWNDTGGGPWVRMQSTLDAMFAELESFLVEQVAAAKAEAVIDVGCGTGATTLAMARRLGPGARCVGVDVSEPMVALARQRAADDGAAAEFVLADAARHRFTPGAADVIASRFGVMFFDDPVAAFANLLAATRDGGALRAIVWRGSAENPFMTAAEEAAAEMLALPPRQPDAPGQFAFADRDRVRAILADAGWSNAEVEPVDFTCAIPAARLDTYLGTMGPVGRALVEHDAATAARVVEHVRPAFDRFRHGDDVRFTAACWLMAAAG
jgi:SAM-dependent methyltransferase